MFYFFYIQVWFVSEMKILTMIVPIPFKWYTDGS